MTAPNWKVAKEEGEWTVTSPTGARWAPLPSLTAAVELATSLVDVEAMLNRISRPTLTVVADPRPHAEPKPKKHYGFRRAAL